MWNLSSALYYKGGGKPWKLATAREGVCYVGLAFRRADATYTKGGPNTAACAAQMFLDDGDGVVFLGGLWAVVFSKKEAVPSHRRGCTRSAKGCS